MKRRNKSLRQRKHTQRRRNIGKTRRRKRLSKSRQNRRIKLTRKRRGGTLPWGKLPSPLNTGLYKRAICSSSRCEQVFDALHWKHLCSQCNEVFCSSCIQRWDVNKQRPAKIPYLGGDKVCKTCYDAFFLHRFRLGLSAYGPERPEGFHDPPPNDPPPI